MFNSTAKLNIRKKAPSLSVKKPSGPLIKFSKPPGEHLT